jgi:hypothetical protein
VGVAGGCRCGAVRYTVDVPRLPDAYACHCTDCQTWSGSAFTLQFFVPDDRLTVGGEVVEYRFVNPLGRISVQRFCPVCHTRLYNSNMARPGIVNVRAGTLDDSAALRVPVHIWVRSRQPWVRLPDDAQTFAEAGDPAAMMALAARNLTP